MKPKPISVADAHIQTLHNYSPRRRKKCTFHKHEIEFFTKSSNRLSWLDSINQYPLQLSIEEIREVYGMLSKALYEVGNILKKHGYYGDEMCAIIGDIKLSFKEGGQQ
ncbi:MAG: hypothetical protein IJP44_10200 [Bacteroidales bacterium]|nr:hypothetical protein [Bacteroidales bacterium]